MMEKISLRLLRAFDPEVAHSLAIKALQMGLSPTIPIATSARLKTKIAGLSLPNPVGLAAGFDKNVTALSGLSRSGFGFVEVGAATPLPQPGNAKPRLFRLSEDRAVINRFGFNNDGMAAIAERLSKRPKGLITGLNLGANKASDDRDADFAKVLAHCGPYVDFATVNVSSPNTEKLRDLQGKDALGKLLAGVMKARAALKVPIPIFLKIAPDLDQAALQEIAKVAIEQNLDAVVATNTTLARVGLKSHHRDETGGLSGKPLFVRSTRILAELSHLLAGRVPLIGVGGVSNAQDAYDKICAGASAVQLYSALVYDGVSLVGKIVTDLDRILERHGFASIEDAVGCRVQEFR